MEQNPLNKSWRLAINNPNESTDWRPLWKFDEDQYATYQELAKNLNQINAPIQLRIVPDTDL